MLTEFIRCEECGDDTMTLNDGPDGQPVWVCFSCSRFWEDQDGKPHGEGEPLGGYRLSIKWDKA